MHGKTKEQMDWVIFCFMSENILEFRKEVFSHSIKGKAFSRLESVYFLLCERKCKRCGSKYFLTLRREKIHVVNMK
jgi:hypothetical protein